MKWIFESFAFYGDQNAVIDGGKTFSYAELDRQIQTYASSLASLPKGSVVAILADYSFEAVALFLALMQHRCIIVPITSQIPVEVTEKLNKSSADAQISILDGELKITLREYEASHPLIEGLQHKGHSGLILFSSGSTGKPKAMIHDLDTLL